jgi:Dolichyl-phosphate-mannose-protein mannosyltransferase
MRQKIGTLLQFNIEHRSGLLFIFAAALIIRAGSSILFSGEIDGEGAEYARLAQNLLAGRGYIGIGHEGTNLFFPPLFPFLIAGVTLITGDADISGRLISIIMGALLIVPVYLISRRMYGKTIGLGSAALIAFHPYLVQFSTTVHCEPTYLTFLMAALYSAMYATENPTGLSFTIAGILYGLAYLVRPEVLILMLVGTTFIFLGIILFRRQVSRATVGRILLVPFAFVVVAAPYVCWLSLQIGEFRMEGKSTLNIETELRALRGLSIDEARMAIDPDLTVRGVTIQPNINIIKNYRLDLKGFATMIAKRFKTVLRNTSTAIASSWEFGSPPLFALAVLGLFGRPWRPTLALDQLHLLTVLSISVFALFFIFYTDLRFYLLFLVVFCIWAPVGVAGIIRWVQRSATVSGLGREKKAFLENAAWILAVLAVLSPSAVNAASTLSHAHGTRSIKAASIRFAGSSGHIRIADASTLFAFHAGAEFTFLPYCAEATALRYIERMRVTHIVVRDTGLTSTPYLEKWMKFGVPDARQVLGMVADTGERIYVYQIQFPKGS